MSCPIVISGIVATGPGGGVPTSVVVSGTATCKAVNLDVRCGIGGFAVGPIPVSNLGTWSADITVLAEKFACNCGSRYVISASCADLPGCNPVILEIESLQCKDEPPGCPEITAVTANVSGCIGVGSSATVAFAATIQGSASGCSFLWSFGDGTPMVTTTVPTVAHTYAFPGTFAVGLTVFCSATCIKLGTVSVTVRSCCAFMDRLDASMSGCVGSFHAETDPPNAAGSFTWSFGDGTPPQAGAANISHSYAVPGSYNVIVDFKPADPKCPTTFAQATVQAGICGSGDPDMPLPTPEGTGCFFLRAAMVIAAIVASLAALLIPCIPAAATVLTWLAVGLGILAFAAGIFWAIFCTKPCGWEYLFGWQFTLGLGLASLAFSTCCPILIPVGIGLVLIAFGLIALWRRHCKPSNCKILGELAIAVTATIAPLIAWLLLVPAIALCQNTLYTAAIGTLSAVIAVMLAKCASGPGGSTLGS